MELQQIQLISYRYELTEEIGRGGMGVVYKALDRLTREHIALKRVAMPLDRLVFSGANQPDDLIRSLAREFRTLASLRHPHIISVLDFGFDQERVPYYTMDYIERPVNIREAAASLEMFDKIALILQTLQTVAYLHRRGVLHRDLKPDNVLVVDGLVKVMDFGLAVDAPTDDASQPAELIGTINYMAPELFSGVGYTRSSDLWAVGIMLYEIIAGVHPFRSANITGQIQAIVNQPLNLSLLGDNPNLTAIVDRLLEKSPDLRYTDAKEVISDLAEAIDHPALPETRQIRESYLQASRFVGREQELGALTQALEEASRGLGSAWLIGGESGVGKSRLLDELRIDALTKGALVLSSRARAEQGSPYALWTEVLRQLSIRSTLSDLEASVLKAVVPDIERLIGRSVGDPPSLEGQNAQMRLISVIEDVIRRQQLPLLLILEDLHWAQESFTLIKHLSRIVQEIPVMLVASYRDDEAPHLPDQLPNMHLIPLRRLGAEEIQQLSEAIIGESARKVHMVEFLERETEGNALCLVEVIRVLAEQAGQLERISQITLPVRILADGIRTPILNRINRLLEDDRLPLRLAAVAGRQLDLALISAAFPGFDVDNWLVRCSDVSLLEFSDNAWRFTHDRVREVILEALDSPKRREFHRQIAETLESVYAGKPDHAAEIAFHWEHALDVDHPDVFVLGKTIDALEAAGQYALSTYAYDEILDGYHHLVELEQRHRQVVSESQGTAKPITDERIAAWHSELGYAELIAWDFIESRDHLEKASALLGFPIPKKGLPVAVGIAAQLMRQTFRSAYRKLIPARITAEQREILTKVSHLDSYLGDTYYWTNDALQSLYVNLRALNNGEKAGPSAELARSYAFMCVVTNTFGLKKQAQRYYERGLEVCKKLGMPHLEAVVLHTTAVMFLHQGKIAKAQEDLRKSIELAKAAGDITLLRNINLLYATSYMVLGDLEQASQVFEHISQDAFQANDLGRRIDALSYLARLDMIRGENAKALEGIDLALGLLKEANLIGPLLLDPWAFGAWIYASSGAYEQAFEAAEMAFRHAKEYNTTGAIGMFTYAYLADAYSAFLSEKGSTFQGVDLGERLRDVAKAISVLGVTASEPIALRVKGLAALQQGKASQAYDLWRRSASSAQAILNPLEEAHAYVLLAQHLPASDPDKQKYRQLAEEILTRIGAKHYLSLLKQAA